MIISYEDLVKATYIVTGDILDDIDHMLNTCDHIDNEFLSYGFILKKKNNCITIILKFDKDNAENDENEDYNADINKEDLNFDMLPNVNLHFKCIHLDKYQDNSHFM